MADPVKSPLYDVQAQAGAEFEDFDGFLWTAHLGDVMGEYETVRTGAGLWDVYPLVKWDFSGTDALRAAQRVFTNDVVHLQTGQVRYGAFVDDTGNMVDDGTIYKLTDDHCWVMTNLPGYDAYFAGAMQGLDVKIEDRTYDMPLISLQGPDSRAVLSKVTDADLSELRYFRFWPERVQVAGIPAWVLRTGFSGEVGYELIPDRDRAVELWNALQAAGARPFGTHAIEIARIEAGLIVAGVEYEPGVRSPYDLSLDRMVAIDDPACDFLGKDRLTQIAADPPNRFKTLRIKGTAVPGYGTAVMLGGEEEVGTLTSAIDSPPFGVIGLAVLRSDQSVDGTQLQVAVEGGAAEATVAPLSIYDPQKRKPRG
ncbi:MAG: aminomethyltransferase family protein [Actinomycetota bacterium]